MTSPLLWFLLGVLSSLAALWLSSKIHSHVRRQRHVDHRQFEEGLTKYIHQMAGLIEDRQDLVNLLTETLPQELGIKQAALLFVEDQQLVAANGMQLPINHSIVRQVAAGGEATLVTHEFERIIAQGRTDLHWVAVWIPILRHSTLHGIWLLGARRQDLAYTPSHLQWLTTLARQVALLLETLSYAEREQATARQMQALYHQSVSSGEVERQRLARELHDGVLQDLCALARDLKALAHNSANLIAQQASLEAYANDSVATLRAICHNLRPPFLGNSLPLALRALVERLEHRTVAFVSFKTNIEAGSESNLAGLELPEALTIAIYRITQESLTNAIQHAQASEVLVRLTQYPNELRLTIHDDGCGILGITGRARRLGRDASEGDYDLSRFVEQGHFGLAGMFERAKMIGARLEVYSAKDYGTAVILVVPNALLQPDSAEARFS